MAEMAARYAQVTAATAAAVAGGQIGRAHV